MSGIHVLNGMKSQIKDELEKMFNEGRPPWATPYLFRNHHTLGSKFNFSGFNNMYACLLSHYKKWDSTTWVTFKQLQNYNAEQLEKDPTFKPVFIQKGSTGSQFTIWKPSFKEVDGERVWAGGYRSIFTAFNECQLTGKLNDIPRNTLADDTIETFRDAVMASYPGRKPIIKNEANTVAYYNDIRDVVNVPELQWLRNGYEWKCCLAHELIHSTGNTNRLSRPGITDRYMGEGNQICSYEEIVAELGALMLLAAFDVQLEDKDITNSAVYAANWSRAIKDKNIKIDEALEDAMKAVRFIMNKKVEEDGLEKSD